MKSNKAKPISHVQADCSSCEIRTCPFFGAWDSVLKNFQENIVHFEMDRGELLYAEGSDVQGIFYLHRGMIKLSRRVAGVHSRIVGVLNPDDIAGLEALVASKYLCDAVALTSISVCRISPAAIQNILLNQCTDLQLKLMARWHVALKDAYDWLADLNFGSARQRVCRLILKMKGRTDADIAVLFSREDMGSMLNLQLETVSREISCLVNEGAIRPLDKQGRIYRVIKMNLGQDDL
jgi:CRP/FNR family transcriptional regulator